VTAPFSVEPLAAHHDKSGFACGVDALDRYLTRQAGQDVRRRVTACYVACETGCLRVVGYYTLAAACVPLADLPDDLGKRLPRYPAVPVARLGRLAVDRDYQGRRLGGALLWDALMRAIRSEIAVFALIVDAKDERAEQFYRHHGFQPLASLPGRMILSLARWKGNA
jgi:GNAT superfamily N-acetyltransferase